MTRPPGRDGHILVVDDDAAVREAVSAALVTKYVVHAVTSGAEACAILQTYPVAVIILDVLLRQEHGLDLVERFRRLSSAHIVILTGHGTEDLAVRALRARVSEYLKKPVSVVELLAVLGRLIPERPRMVDTVARARRYLDEFPAKPFRTAELASRLGVSETHLRRLFRAAQRQTLRQYLAEVRVRRAAELLERDGRSVKEVALEIGFPNARLFRRTFTRFFGVSPIEWQRGHRAHRMTLRSDPS